ncbi:MULTISPECIES: GspH/FimT family pseudopilin [Vibrio]|nr:MULTISPECIES: GspH/FimT family pseudopilin [Vibrio]AIV04703.1 pilus assembly protein FimT [Vibrio harveyi]APP06759.1 pilus assembly protein FimT [Vibrio harveyi]EKM15338.1 prepilin-type N-terminal cleavage/methylation domain protein [Vibrio harveyi]EKO3804282.1 GspH/FimT family pseudopilin [Vibrio harveyi]EKO3808033.1 GspH/FimT family pseudopilin [Vibrio harveyi]
MPRGFTLLELLITIAVLSVLLTAAAPSFQNVFETNKMQRLANELHGFVIQGKSEAVLRRERLWAHLIMSGGSSSDGNWRIELTDNSSEGAGTVLFSFSGAPYKGIVVTPSYASDQISFDDVHGRPSSGNIRFYPVGESSKALKLISHTLSARVRVCSDNNNTEFFGYSTCS